MATGILKYLDLHAPRLPEPNGLLSKKVPSKAIELANTEVAKLKEQPCGRGSYLILIPAQQFEIGEW